MRGEISIKISESIIKFAQVCFTFKPIKMIEKVDDVFFTNKEVPSFLVLLFGDKANNSTNTIVTFKRVYYFLVSNSLYTKAAFLYMIKSL